VYPEERGTSRHWNYIVGEVAVMEWICDHAHDIYSWQKENQDTHPCFFPQGRIDKIYYKPCDAKRDYADHDHSQRVNDREKIVMDYHRDGIEERPEKYFYAQEEKAAKPTVTYIAEPEHTHDIRYCAAYEQRQNGDNQNAGHVKLPSASSASPFLLSY